MQSDWDKLFASIPAVEAQQRYCIAFTARSGSTWLESLLTNSGILGIPQEWFNTRAAKKTITLSGSQDLPEYYRYLKTIMTKGNIFGLELAWPQARLVFEAGYTALFDDMQYWFYLRRRDYVAQGVSLFKAIQSGRFHSVQTDRPAIAVAYDSSEIAASILRILAAEFEFKSYFAKKGLQPHELWHEDLIAVTPREVVMQFVQALQIPETNHSHINLDRLNSAHTKIGDSDSALMIERFREENLEFMDYWDQFRGEKSAREFRREFPAYELT